MKSFFTLIISIVILLAAPFSMTAQNIFISSQNISPELEHIYLKGLAYLGKNQDKKTGHFTGQYGNSPGVIGLCVVAMLAHGEDPNYGHYSENVKLGLNAILNAANKSNGYIGTSMYEHGFATLALAEAYGTVNDDRIGPTLKRAVELILSSQARNSRGAWRYGPESQDADTTVSGAVAVALFAAANAGIQIPDESIQKALKFYESCQSGDGGFGYTHADSSNYPRTAIAALVFALAKKKDSNFFKQGIGYLHNRSPNDSGGHYYHYGLYYASQAIFQLGTESWEKWNQINIKVLKETQTEDGSWNGQQGAAFTTAAALLSMALNYRYLPIYER